MQKKVLITFKIIYINKKIPNDWVKRYKFSM